MRAFFPGIHARKCAQEWSNAAKRACFAAFDHSYYAPWHFLYFFPLPQGQGSLRPTLPEGRGEE